MFTCHQLFHWCRSTLTNAGGLKQPWKCACHEQQTTVTNTSNWISSWIFSWNKLASDKRTVNANKFSAGKQLLPRANISTTVTLFIDSDKISWQTAVINWQHKVVSETKSRGATLLTQTSINKYNSMTKTVESMQSLQSTNAVQFILQSYMELVNWRHT